EGKTRKQAAGQLGLPEGTVAGRLARAPKMLAKRLTRRGIALSAGALASLLAQQAAAAVLPASVASSTIKAIALGAAGQALGAGGGDGSHRRAPGGSAARAPGGALVWTTVAQLARTLCDSRQDSEEGRRGNRVPIRRETPVRAQAGDSRRRADVRDLERCPPP